MDDRIEQHVDIADRGQAGDITLIGKMVYVVKNPAQWQEALWRFLGRHRDALLVLLVLEAGLAAAMLLLKDRYLIAWGTWALAAGALAAATGGCYAYREARRWPQACFSAAASLVFVAVVGWEGRQIVFPAQFETKVFGIAVAELGEGSGYRMTETSRQLTDQIYEFLRQTVEQRDTAHGSGRRAIAVRKLGVISSSDMARAAGEQIGAEMVIWGQVVTAEPHITTIRFYMLEMLDRADDPEFPFVMPVVAKSTDVSVRELNLAPDTVAIKQAVADESRLVASYISGLIYYLDQDFPAAVPELTTALATVRDNPALTSSPHSRALLAYYLGTATQRLGRYDEAEEILLEAATLNPDEPAIPLGLAFGYRHLGLEAQMTAQLDRAFALLNRWLSTHPDDTTALYDRGMAYHLRERPDLGMLEYERILKLMPEFYVAHINLGRAYGKLGRFADAEAVLTAAITLAAKHQTNSGMAWLQLAVVREYGGDAAGARAAYVEAVAQLPDVWWPHFYYAQFLEKNGELAAAAAAYNTMLETSTDKPWAYRVMGDFARRTGDLSSAVIYYQLALDAGPDSALLHTYLAETYARLGQQAAARGQFEQAVAAGERSFYPYASYGAFLYGQGEYVRAAALYEQAVARDGAGVNELLTLARIYRRVNDCEHAQASYRRLLALGAELSEDLRLEAEVNLETLVASCGPQEDNQEAPP